MSDFVHLHLHSEFSLLNGVCRISEISQSVKDIGQNAVAITDSSVLYGVVDFYTKIKSAGLKPIIGCELLIFDSRIVSDNYISKHPYKMIALCENNVGYSNLLKIVSKSNSNIVLGKPCVDLKTIEQYKNGLIFISEFYGGIAGSNISVNNQDNALKFSKVFVDIIGNDNFYLELQNHKQPDDLNLILKTLNIAEKLNVETVAGNDVRYLKKEDSVIYEIVKSISNGSSFGDTNKDSADLWLKSGEEMISLFSDYPTAISNTVKVAKRCNVEINTNQICLPEFIKSGVINNEEYFLNQCQKGLLKRYGENPDKIVLDRLEYEISVIRQMGYVDYFLIVQDFVLFAKSREIAVGPGRGSGAGSLVAYCMGITDIDPIKYNLLFERFLNPERVSMPDFDIDFCFERRFEVIDYLESHYGIDHCAQIITFGTFAARAAIKDISKILEISYKDVDQVLKNIPVGPRVTIENSLKQSTSLNQIYNENPKIKKMMDLSCRIEGLPKYPSVHASGVVITKDKLDSYVPVSVNSDKSVVAQYSMNDLSKIGLLKFDILGLRTLTVISDTIKNIGKFNLKDINYNDNNVYEMLSQGYCDGVFQFESAGLKSLLKKMRPKNLEDLVAAVSLYRPGPMDFIPEYLKNRMNPENISYNIPQLKPILDVTYGCIIYQEQVMQIFRDIAGFSYAHSDMVRRAMAKKDESSLEAERQSFIFGMTDDSGNKICDGAVENGVSIENATKLFDKMKSFSNYAYNKSHAVSYAHISFQTAYLKYYYPAHFFAALMTNVCDDKNKLYIYVVECRRIGVKILPPDINQSFEKFTVENNQIRFGLTGIKNISNKLIEEIIFERKSAGLFVSFEDFCIRMSDKSSNLNKTAMESLIKSGAFECLSDNIGGMLASLDDIMDFFVSSKTKNINQMQFFVSDLGKNQPKLNIKDVDSISEGKKLLLEKDVLGLYLSGHPIDEYTLHSNQKINFLSDLTECDNNQRISIICVVNFVNQKYTKAGKAMAFIGVEDKSALAEVIVFPDVFEKFNNLLFAGNILNIECTVNKKENNIDLICNNILIPAPQNNAVVHKKSNKYKGLHLLLSSEESPLYKQVLAILSLFSGENPVYIKFENNQKRVLLPKNLSVSLDGAMVNYLKMLLGNDNVVIIE